MSFIKKYPQQCMIGISGLFILLSFIMSLFGYNSFFDVAWISVIISGYPLVKNAVNRLINNKGISKISSSLLISIAMIASICIGDVFAAGEVAFIMAIGEMLEDFTINRAKKGLVRLSQIAPEKGRVVIDNNEMIVKATEIKQGDIVRVLPGEKIPVDGIIISGETSVDQAVITGESLPVDKVVDDSVFCGSINCNGAIDIKASSNGKDTSLHKIFDLINNVDCNKASVQRIADKWASLLVPMAFVIAIIGGFVARNISVAVTVLVVFCPCALVLATPTAIMAAIGQATKNGVVIKSGQALEKMGEIEAICFDKTGTLTYGKLEFSDMSLLDNRFTKKQLLSIMASVEKKSEHPIGKAIVYFAQENSIPIMSVDSFNCISGKGVSATIKGVNVFCGNKKFMLENEIELDESALDIADGMSFESKAVVYLALNKHCVAIVGLSDKIRSEATSVVRSLKNDDVKTFLLTGDTSKSAQILANTVGINKVEADLLPVEKVEIIQKIKTDYQSVCMIGDGVNDAPALKIADVGIAMGNGGTDIAVDSADIVVLNDDLNKLKYLRWIAKQTTTTIKISIITSMIINIVGVCLSILGVLNPTTGALVHNAGSVLVILFAALLYDRKYK